MYAKTVYEVRKEKKATIYQFLTNLVQKSILNITIMRLFYIAIFGLLGVFARFFLGTLIGKALTPPFPYGTFFINIVGSFLIGVIYVIGVDRAFITAELRTGIMVGFLGGFTTFSSYCLEISQLIEDAEYWYAALYFSLSPVLGLVACLGGLFLTRFLLRGAL